MLFLCKRITRHQVVNDTFYLVLSFYIALYGGELEGCNVLTLTWLNPFI